MTTPNTMIVLSAYFSLSSVSLVETEQANSDPVISPSDPGRKIFHDPVSWAIRIHQLHLCRRVSLPNDCPDMTLNHLSPVGWNRRIHWLHLCKGLRIPHRVSWIWHYWWLPSNAGALGNAENPFIAIAPRSTLARSGSIWNGPIWVR